MHSFYGKMHKNFSSLQLGKQVLQVGACSRNLTGIWKSQIYHIAGGRDCIFVTPPSTGTTTCMLESTLGATIASGLYL